MISVEQYLQRIGITEKKKPDLDFLTVLQYAHLLSVPFETHDIHSGIRIICDEEKFLHKILVRKRGGFCYELNASFAWLLRNLGYRLTLLSGRVARPDGSFGPEFDHMALLVHLERDYVVDVGFTNFSTTPMTLDNPVIHDTLGTAQIRKLDNDDFIFSRIESDAVKTEYLFTLMPHRLQDFETMCRFHESSPESPFIEKPLASIHTKTGRRTISGNTLIILENGSRTRREISDGEKNTLLQEQFGICQ
ncbi:MAG: arylamine N-acetyltransferase [Candidatus Kapaibacterium sp.]